MIQRIFKNESIIKNNYIVDENNSSNSERGPILQSEANQSEIERNKTELERILNMEVLSQPPFLEINLCENLIPITINSTLEDLIKIMD
jgi:hypothetical protein